MFRFFRNCPFFTTVIIILTILFFYGVLLCAQVIEASDNVDTDFDPETTGVATAVQDIKGRFLSRFNGEEERDYTSDYLPTEYVPNDEIKDTFGITDEETAGKDTGKEGSSEMDEEDAAAAARRAERSERMKNGERDQYIRDAFKTKLKENDHSDPGDRYDGFYSVPDSYFTGGDTVIIGDSREEGFGLYSGLEGIVSYAQKSYSVNQVFTKKWIDSEYGKLTLEEAMAANKGKFKKIYIKFGLNEIGWADEQNFDNAYYQLIDMLKYYQSDAVIYLQSIINVTQSKSNESKNVFNNENINVRNEAIKKIAEKEHIAYLDLNSVLADENGCLPEDYASDGIHIKQKYMGAWVDFLKTHAVIKDGDNIPGVDEDSLYDPDASDELEDEDSENGEEDESQDSVSSDQAGSSVSEDPVSSNSSEETDPTAPVDKDNYTVDDWKTGAGL